jgi:hypothetical protein
MGYYFYPDAVASIEDNPNGGKKDRPRWLKVLLVVALAMAPIILILILISL